MRSGEKRDSAYRSRVPTRRPDRGSRDGRSLDYRDAADLGAEILETHPELSGFAVEAIEGSIGKVDGASYDVGRSFVVVDTGAWILSRKVVLPAGVIRAVDESEEVVFVNRTKDDIRNAPEYDESADSDDTHRSALGAYYGSAGSGYRDWDDVV